MTNQPPAVLQRWDGTTSGQGRRMALDLQGVEFDVVGTVIATMSS
jgi:hypothetical protein